MKPESANDHQPLTDEDRQVLREKIAQGIKSLREGRVTDGEEFMARMDSELAVGCCVILPDASKEWHDEP